MLSLKTYIIEAVSDSAILYQIGKHKYNWQRSDKKEQIKSKYNITKNNFRAGIVSYARNAMAKLLKDDGEIIHRKDWDLKGLIGETEKQLLHPDYWTTTQYILKNYKKKHDILVILECSNSKPYCENHITKNNYLLKYRAFADFACMSNPGVIPMEYSYFYPYRYDEWDHGAEDADIADKYCKVNMQRFIHYVKTMGYKHVLVLMQNPHPQKLFDMMDKDNIENCNSWMHIVSDSGFRSTLKQKYLSKFKNEGILITRTMSLPYTRECLEREIKKYLNADQKSDFEELLKIIHDKDLSSQKRAEAIEKWNNEHDCEPIDITKGITNSAKKYTPESDIVKSQVTKYESFVKKFFEELPDRLEKAKKSEKYHTERVCFSTLDLLFDFYGDKIIKDPDTEYWNMNKAIHNCVNDDIENYAEYMWYYKPLLKDLDKDKLILYMEKLGLTQPEKDKKDR